MGMPLQPELVSNMVFLVSVTPDAVLWTVSWPAVSCSEGTWLCALVLAGALFCFERNRRPQHVNLTCNLPFSVS